ncbi:MAG: NADPH:quinone reductase [Demequina sp.]
MTAATTSPSDHHQAVIYTQTGDESVLQLVERPFAEPGPGEVRVRMMVSGVNPTDWKSRRGKKPGESLHFDEVVPNQDGAGVVDAVSPDVAGLAIGDRVWVYLAQFQRPTGTAQQFTVLPAERVVPLPANASFDEGASMGVPAMTAHRALTVADGGPDHLSPGALTGQTVLVAGGAGAVGHAAIQLARWAGATVITTISSREKAALATAAGAHHTVNYRDGDAAAAIRAFAPDGVDVVVEVALAPNIGLDRAVIRPRATIASYANDGGDTLSLEIISHMVSNTRLQFILLYTVGQEALDAAAHDVTAALADGALRVGREHGLPLHRFALSQTAQAHAAVQNGAVGKVLIDIDADIDGDA